MLLQPREPSHQLATIRPLATSLYDSTRRSSVLSETRNELSLLVTLLGATEKSALCLDSSHPALARILQKCHLVLLDLQKLQTLPSGSGLIPDIRARFSSLIFELGALNADMSISSQNHVDRLMRGFIDEIHAGKRDTNLVSTVLDDSISSSQQEHAWRSLQQELQEVGISPDLSTQDHSFIISTLRNAVDKENLVPNTPRRPPPPPPPPPPPKSRTPFVKPAEDQPRSMPAEKNATLIAPVPSYDSGHSDKEVVPLENFPIPVSSEIQDTDDSEKQALPIDNFPIPVASEMPFTSDDSDKQVLPPPENLPIPVLSETNSETRSETSSSTATATPPPPSAPPAKPKRSKRPSLVSRMKFKLTSSKEEFITLIQMGGLYSVKLALDKGADVNTSNLEAQTALMVAASYGHEQIVELLLEYGALTDKASTRGDTALGVAALRGFEGILYKLLAKGASVNMPQSYGKTALSQAAETGREKIVRILLDRGADVNAVCHTGDTALSQAAQGGHLHIAQLLLDRGALVDRTAYPRRTPLFKAVQQGRPEMAKLLMEHGADPTCKDSIRSQTPLSLAAMHGHREILSTLRKYGYEVTPSQYC